MSQPRAREREAFWRDLTARFDRRIRGYARTTQCDEQEVDEIVWNVWDDAVAAEEQLAAAADPWDVLLPIVRGACAGTMRRVRHEQPLDRGVEISVTPRREADDIS